MPLKKKEIEFYKEVFKKLEIEYGVEKLYDEIEKDTESIYFPFPVEEEIEVEIDDLEYYFNEIDTLRIHDYNRVTTDTITQRVVTASVHSPLVYLGVFSKWTDDEVCLMIKTEPILIGLAASQKKEYSKYHPPCSSHWAVEVRYPSKERRLSKNDEEKLIWAFLFELAHDYRIAFSFSTFIKESEYHEEPEYYKEALQKDTTELSSSIEDYNPAMELFIKANQGVSDDLKYLIYYKVFEYFAPFYSRMDAFEAMRKKLDSSNVNLRNGDFVASIFELTKNYEKSIRDKELIKSVIDNTFDLIDIYANIPISIRQKINVVKLEYKSKRDLVDRVINHLGDVLYATRNGIVHAKSNFEPTGVECPDEDLEQLNEFMHMACYSTIKWYNRLPEHLKMS